MHSPDSHDKQRLHWFPLSLGIAIGLLLGLLLAGSALVTTSKSATTAIRIPASGEALPPISSLQKPLELPGVSQLSRRGRHFSQVGQDKVVDKLLGGMTGGFYVESGAYDGVTLSNSLFFEATRGWSGLLVEANPILFQDIMQRSGRSNATAIHACLSPTSQPSVLPFKMAGALGGLVGEMSEQFQKRVEAALQPGSSEPFVREHMGSGQTVNVSCWPLASMLQVMGVSRVDFWSLDTEGSEAAILAATDFDAVDIRVMLVEVNDAAAEAKVQQVMARRPEYKLYRKLDWDLLYVKDGVLGGTS